jgi:hypothetical protein
MSPSMGLNGGWGWAMRAVLSDSRNDFAPHFDDELVALSQFVVPVQRPRSSRETRPDSAERSQPGRRSWSVDHQDRGTSPIAPTEPNRWTKAPAPTEPNHPARSPETDPNRRPRDSRRMNPSARILLPETNPIALRGTLAERTQPSDFCLPERTRSPAEGPAPNEPNGSPYAANPVTSSPSEARGGSGGPGPGRRRRTWSGGSARR